jgi:hypothetical protein
LTRPADVRRYRWLIGLVVASIAVRVLASLAMLGPLAAGLDVKAPVAARAAWVAEHPWLWRVGWLPWLLTAASDLAVSVALFAYLRAVPGRPGARLAAAALVATMAALVPDQWGEALAVTRLVELAAPAAAA